MFVLVMTNFETTFTGDLFKSAWQNNDFVSKVSIPPPPPPQKKKKKEKIG